MREMALRDCETTIHLMMDHDRVSLKGNGNGFPINDLDGYNGAILTYVNALDALVAQIAIDMAS
jgi:hypothetical protein